MRSLRVVVNAVLVVALVVPVLWGVGGSAAYAGEVSLQRLQGASRVATAVAVARAAFPDGASTVIVARADDFPDAMSAAALAGAYDAPVLLSDRDRAPAELVAALRDLGAQRVVLAGGQAALSASVQRELAGHVAQVDRINGDSRYATAAALAAEVARRSGIGSHNGKRTVFVASGVTFPDALAAGPIAFAGRHPILLTTPEGLHPATAGALRSLGVEHAIVLGGAGAVSGTVEHQIRQLGVTTERAGGRTRTDTAARIADLGVTRFGLDAAAAYLVRGDAFPDALVTGPAAGKRNSPILLTASPYDASLPAQQWFADRCDDVDVILTVGGEGAVSTAAASAAQQAAIHCEVRGAHGIAGTAIDATNTGPTAYHDPQLGRRLTYNDLQPTGTITTTHHGQIIEKVDVTGSIRIQHDDVTIRAARVSQQAYYGISGSGARATIEYVELDGSDNADWIGILYGPDWTVRHSEVRGHSTGVRLRQGGRLESSYIHSQVLKPGSHNAAAAFHGGSGVRVINNHLVGSTSSSLSLYPDNPVVDAVVQGNLFNGGSYCLYAGYGSKPGSTQSRDIRITDNVFARDPYPECGHYGPYTNWDASKPGNQWRDNVYEDGAVVD
jgi:putative cell wall-binding protein